MNGPLRTEGVGFASLRQLMSNPFFDHPILNSPYDRPSRHWELVEGQPTQQIIEARRRAEFITPIPKPRKRKAKKDQERLDFQDDEGVSTAEQKYDPHPLINQLRQHLEAWRSLPNPSQWQVTHETARLLQHWRSHKFSGARPFFCQVEAAETAIWLTEVAPQHRQGKAFLEHLQNANREANPALSRLALKLATGAGKTTVMAMLIAWQAINAARRPQGKWSRGFLIVAPGLTIKDRLRVLQPSDPDLHVAKGLEFRAVAVMACDDEVIPLQERIETVADEADLEDVYNTERHLLYVACTRARDRLLISSVKPASEFLDDLATSRGKGR